MEVFFQSQSRGIESWKALRSLRQFPAREDVVLPKRNGRQLNLSAEIDRNDKSLILEAREPVLEHIEFAQLHQRASAASKNNTRPAKTLQDHQYHAL